MDFEKGLYIEGTVKEPFFEGGEKKKEGKLKKSKDRSNSELKSSKGKLTESKFLKEGGDKRFLPMNLELDEKDEDAKKQQQEDHQNFVKKVYGIFSAQIFVITIYLYLVMVLKPEKVKNEKDKMVFPTDDAFLNFAYSKVGLAIASALCLGCTGVIICKMSTLQRKVPLNYILTAVNTFALSYIAGYVAITKSEKVVLMSGILTFGLSIMMAFLSGKMINAFANGKMAKALGPAFGILGTIVVLVCLLAVVWGQAAGNMTILGISFVIVFIYMLLDTFAIVNGKYDKMISKEDYIYGANKLFFDFVLCFTLIATMIGSDD